jgi:glycosyltransferase involved in cell wall biosynthesis
LKKILFIVPNLNAGGAERVALNYLRQLDLEEYLVSLVCFQKTEDLLSLIPPSVEIIDLKTCKATRSYLPLLNLLHKLRPDVVFTTHSRVAALLYFVKPFAPRFRHLARMLNSPGLEKRHAAYGFIRRKLFGLGFFSANVVIAQTEEMKEDGIKVFGLKEEKVQVLSNPLDIAFIDKCLDGTQSPFPSGKITAVASGRLAYQKGFDVLLSAVPAVLSEYPDFMLYIIGSDVGEEGNLRNLVKKLSLERCVTFLGFQSNPYRYYTFCDLFILSSRWEGFPNALLENYYLDTPIVSAECVPIVSKLVKDGVNGYVCDVEDEFDLSEKVLQCIKSIKRGSFKNDSYKSSRLEILF